MKKLWAAICFVTLIVMMMAAPVLADGPVENRAGRAELRFLEGMIDHHQMALDMAADCLEKASSESVSELCQNIIAAQSAEIEMMQGWLLDWYNVDYQPVAMRDMDDAMGGHSGHGMTGMPHQDPSMMMGMMAGLNRLEGVEYDVAWLEAMIDHHDDAIHMSERLLARVPGTVGHEALLTLAQQIIDDQSGEIADMEALISELAAA
ncbi:MAG: DUF305 domain-containing protein [Anaerolineae bacterium]|nr:DUF305 domain-containing protein [Anaerolineae bacterium]